MRTLSLIIFFLITTLPVSAQQWVLDEIAEEHDSSESIPTWLVGVLLIIGFFVYKHLQRKDDEEQERRIKEQKYEEEQQLEEQLQIYREQGLQHTVPRAPRTLSWQDHLPRVSRLAPEA